MKKLLVALCVTLALPLAGCMATLGSLSGNGPIAQARRSAYVKAHPDDPYNDAIARGSLAVGMSLDDMQAVYGSNCAYSSQSSLGDFYTCHLDALDYSDVMTVLVDNSGKVASWVQ